MSTPTRVSFAESLKLKDRPDAACAGIKPMKTEDINTVGWPSALMQNHVFECHAVIVALKQQNTDLRSALELLYLALPCIEEGEQSNKANAPKLSKQIRQALAAIAKATGETKA